MRACLAITAILVLGCATAPPRPTASPPPLDFPAVIARGKARVFPAVVFVAVVVDSFEGGRRQRREQFGSGVLISPTGEVITNRHVVEKAVEIRVLTHGGRMAQARKIGEDQATDLALIQLEDEGPTWPHVPLADSSALEPGNFVMAMGAPWGLNRSVTLGILSCTDRYLPGTSEYSLWLQTDASINPGNSGGPLVDTEGRIVGINTLGSTMGGDMGFAVPSNTVRAVIDEIRRHGEVRRAWTGLRLQPLRDFERNMFHPGDRGVLVGDVEAGSPAARAGIEAGDLILSVTGSEVTAVHREDLPAVNALLASLPFGETVSLSLQRGDRAATVSITPSERGSEEGEDLECKAWDFTVKAINQHANPELFHQVGEGIFVQGVRSPGNAAHAGVRRGDVLVRVDGTEVRTLDDLKAVYERVTSEPEREKKVAVTTSRGGLPRHLILDYSTRYGDE